MDKMNLPVEWLLTKLDSLAVDISYGYTASSTSENVGPQMLRITDIQNNQVNWQDVPFCQIDEDKKAKYKLEKGDLLFARTGATVGKSFLLKEEPPESVYASYLIRVRTAHSELTSNLSHFFNSAQYWQQIIEFSSGIGQPNVNGTKLKGLDIPLPPLAEQKVIADKLDKLLAKVDSIKARLDAVPDTLKRFRQSVLAAAVSGKLTEEWRALNKVTGKWLIESADKVCLKVQSGSTPRNNPFDQGGTIPFLKVYNIVNQAIDFDYKPQFITTEVHQEKLKRSIGLPGDVLMNIVGPPLGKVAILTGQYPEWNLNQAITLFRVNPEQLLNKYLYFVLCEGALVRDVVHDTKGIVGQVNISLSQCRQAKIPIPSLEEQAEIVRRVEKLFAYADKVEAEVNAAQQRVNKLTQSILAKAFRGELSAKWREQNPDLISGENSAEALLALLQKERKAEREKLKPNKKTHTRKKV